ncbi:MAG TPA: hypothetical protein PLY93_05410 [Turneriella sp.]|nr:hypothetical protein [Turneriella sp.]
MTSFFTAAHLKLSILLAVLGTLVALIFTILSDSGITALIVRPIVSGLFMFILGSVVFAVLEKKVPEALDVIHPPLETPGEGEALDALADTENSSLEASDEALTHDSSSEADGIDSYTSSDISTSAGSSIPRKTGVQISKDEIVVNGVKFKNQPEVMAETIKQLMDDDKE